MLSVRIIASLKNEKSPRFGSREHENPAARPVLEVNYQKTENITSGFFHLKEEERENRLYRVAYPNPGAGTVNVLLTDPYATGHTEVRSLEGQLISTITFNEQEQIKLRIEGPGGLNLVKLCVDGNRETYIKVVKGM